MRSVVIGILAFLMVLVPWSAQDLNKHEGALSQWDDQPKYGDIVISVRVESITSTDLSLLHMLMMKHIKSLIGERSLQLKNPEGKTFSISFTDYSKEATFDNADGTKGGFFRIELPKLSKKYIEKLNKECPVFIKGILEKESNKSEWSFKIIEKSNDK